jgi:hypothetical protein
VQHLLMPIFMMVVVTTTMANTQTLEDVVALANAGCR